MAEFKQITEVEQTEKFWYFRCDLGDGFIKLKYPKDQFTELEARAQAELDAKDRAAKFEETATSTTDKVSDIQSVLSSMTEEEKELLRAALTE
jgi:hypothetical protein